MEEVCGMVINPGEKCFFLEKMAIADLLRIFSDVREKRNTLSDDARYVSPPALPDGFKDVMTEFIWNTLADRIEKIWLTGIEDRGEKRLAFAVKTDDEDPHEIFDRMHTMVRLLKVEEPVTYLQMDEQPWDGAELIYDMYDESDLVKEGEDDDLLDEEFEIDERWKYTGICVGEAEVTEEEKKSGTR